MNKIEYLTNKINNINVGILGYKSNVFKLSFNKVIDNNTYLFNIISDKCKLFITINNNFVEISFNNSCPYPQNNELLLHCKCNNFKNKIVTYNGYLINYIPEYGNELIIKNNHQHEYILNTITIIKLGTYITSIFNFNLNKILLEKLNRKSNDNKKMISNRMLSKKCCTNYIYPNIKNNKSIKYKNISIKKKLLPKKNITISRNQCIRNNNHKNKKKYQNNYTKNKNQCINKCYNFKSCKTSFLRTNKHLVYNKRIQINKSFRKISPNSNCSYTCKKISYNNYNNEIDEIRQIIDSLCGDDDIDFRNKLYKICLENCDIDLFPELNDDTVLPPYYNFELSKIHPNLSLLNKIDCIDKLIELLKGKYIEVKDQKNYIMNICKILIKQLYFSKLRFDKIKNYCHYMTEKIFDLSNFIFNN
jgi:hypothetical protein